MPAKYSNHGHIVMIEDLEAQHSLATNVGLLLQQTASSLDAGSCSSPMDEIQVMLQTNETYIRLLKRIS